MQAALCEFMHNLICMCVTVIEAVSNPDVCVNIVGVYQEVSQL